MKILWAGIDGLEIDYLNRFEHPFFEKIKDDCSTVEIPCPEGIESGEVATASSPRLWGRYFTACSPERNGILGFWEVVDENGEYWRVEKDLNWIRENRCEKLVDYDNLLVKPLWEVALENGLSVGSCNAWFSYPLSDKVKSMIDENGGWMLTDWKFPRDHERMKPDEYRWPPDAEPKEDFTDETGAGARVGILAQRDPEGLKRGMLKQDEDRYEYVQNQVEKKDVPDLTMMLTRGVDGIQHIVRKGIADEDDLKNVYEINMRGIEKLWNTGEFDVLIITSDHGSDVLSGGDAHSWPAYALLYSEDETIPTFSDLQGKYQDICPTILDLLDIEVPEYMEGDSLLAQARVSESLRDLGYW